MIPSSLSDCLSLPRSRRRLLDTRVQDLSSGSSAGRWRSHIRAGALRRPAACRSGTSILGMMRLTVLGGCGAYPAAGQACSGYLVESEGFRLLVDPGYATVPRLLERTAADRVDAVFVTHGHPDHCADLNPL